MTATPERMIERAHQIEQIAAKWRGNPGFAETCRMEAEALRFHASAVAAQQGG